MIYLLCISAISVIVLVLVNNLPVMNTNRHCCGVLLHVIPCRLRISLLTYLLTYLLISEHEDSLLTALEDGW